MYTYESIKELAKSEGLTVADLCALAPKNDPFYVGRPAEQIAAQWFSDLWRRFGFSTGVHLRRMHYRIVSHKGGIARPDGRTYENTEPAWDFLNEAGKWARYLQLVPATAFVDKRNPEAIINAYWKQPGDYGYRDPNPTIELYNSWDDDAYSLPSLPELPALPYNLPDRPDFEVNGYSSIQQPYHIEVWAEKTTMNDVLIPLCRRYGVNLITGAGELSITAVVEFMKRVEAADRPARILYISDFDPAGLGMPISVARKIEYFQRNEGYEALDIRLHPCVLTADQVTHYSLPRIPVKDSDNRKANFEAAHGEGQVELDALEALYPGELRRIVDRFIRQYFDVSLFDRANTVKQQLIDDLNGRRLAVLDEFGPEWSEIWGEYDELKEDFEATRNRFAALIEDFQPQIDRHSETLSAIKEKGRELFNQLLERLEEERQAVDLDTYALPEANLPEESDYLLYDSRRDYLDQLQTYKAYRNGNGH